MKKPLFNISVNLHEMLPDDFLIKYDELPDWHYGKYKPNTDPSNKLQKLLIRSLKDVDIIYEDTKCIAGRFSVKAINKDGKKIEIPFDYMIGKHLWEKTKRRIRWKTKMSFYIQLSAEQGMSIHRKVVDKLMPECMKILSK